ncbi:MAG: molybdenum cofactor guanylyltransferase [Acidobacteria bacterium]|nr:molybdenum cofactor guanylyltransferase [Acidobacteriota bacterium]MBI3262025.1 molybdenum cofactor guanylyltransferase [Acidobacteriota bacterium]
MAARGARHPRPTQVHHNSARWTAAILAGGAARRFGGRDKSSLIVAGQPILERQFAVLRQVAGSVVVVTNALERQAPPKCQVIGDVVRGSGALGGLLAALLNSTTPWTLALGCDMPFVTAPFLGYLCSLAEGGDVEAVVPRSADGLEPLCAAYSARALAVVRRQVESRSLKMTDLLAQLRVREIPASEVAPFDPRGTLFFNINSPRDYRRALRLAEP